ncbi:hypothetical protein ACN27F_17840 [Solwaraspora sp. WMMB335]|uniref:hypothetical protein n=1 Tax=Solwaraspora sp. WMMB335 TaxID=3404118 RepID=UPI003B937761
MARSTADPAAAGSPTRRRPVAVVTAVLLMLPAALLWLVGGIAFVSAIARLQGDAMFLFWLLAVAVAGLCLLVTLMTAAGMWIAWQGGPGVLRVPAGLTFGLLLAALAVLVLLDKVAYEPTMLTPMVVGGLAGTALLLLATPPARRWLDHRPR